MLWVRSHLREIKQDAGGSERKTEREDERWKHARPLLGAGTSDGSPTDAGGHNLHCQAPKEPPAMTLAKTKTKMRVAEV